jgi:hypothetical protein
MATRPAAVSTMNNLPTRAHLYQLERGTGLTCLRATIVRGQE